MKVEKIVEPVVPVEPVVRYNVQLSAQEAKMLKLICGRLAITTIELLLTKYPKGDISQFANDVMQVTDSLYNKLYDLGVPDARN